MEVEYIIAYSPPFLYKQIYTKKSIKTNFQPLDVKISKIFNQEFFRELFVKRKD